MKNQFTCIISGILCIHLFVSNVSVSHSLSNATKLGEKQEYIRHCENWQFQCKNGQCIAKPFICDGLQDCKDASDETYVQCQNKSSTKCNEEHFQCKYGACIEKKYQCDGLKQCIDESDESPEICNGLEDNSDRIRNRRDIDKSCTAPATSVDKTIDYLCGRSPSESCQPSNGYIPELAVATVNCAAGYYRENIEGSPAHVCFNRQWSPPITKCVKKCDQLNPVNVVLQCYRNGLSIGNCDGNSILLAGTKVRPACKSTYKYDSSPSFFEISCNDEGKWDNILFPCVPECGKPYTSAQLTLAGGNPEPIGGSPWHVAIFNKEQLLICGGTIISEHLVISAAHCFSEDGNSCEGTDCIDEFEVVIGKYTNNYTAMDNSYQKTMKIKEIRFPKKGYFALATYYAADLAILILKDPIPISPAILPACINWVDLKDGKYPSEGEPGKVVGWGRTENGTLSSILRNISLPFISYQRCVDMVDRDFRRFVTFDKFCAGTGNRTGPTALDGDSGGGLLFEDKGLFYLRGVVSVKSSSSNAVTVFTDLTEHVEWIASVRNNIEKIKQKTKLHPNNGVNFLTTYQISDSENAKRRAQDDIVVDLQSHEFQSAEQKLHQANTGTYKYVVKKVYDHHVGNFELLLSFGDSIQDVDKKLKIYDALYYEMRTSGHNDTQKLLQLTQSIKNGIIDRTKGQTATAAQSLFDTLCSVTCCRPQESVVEDIFSAFVNDNSWPTVKKLSADMCENCYQTLVSTYDKVIEKLWNKVNLVDILARAQNNLKSLDERMLIHQKIFNKIIREGILYTNSAISLARHMKLIIDDSTYKSLNPERRSQYEDIKNKLPPSVKNMVFLNQVCIQNIAHGREYLGIDDKFKLKNHHNVFTFSGGFSQRGRVDFWKLHFLGDYQISIETRTGLFLKVTDEIHNSERRYAFASPVVGSDQNYRWNIEFGKDGVLFKNNQYHEFLFADAHETRENSRRYTFTGIGWGPVGDGFWEITDCSNP